MENQTPSASEWTSTKVYLLSAICLLLGVALGALFHGPAQTSPISSRSLCPRSWSVTPSKERRQKWNRNWKFFPHLKMQPRCA